MASIYREWRVALASLFAVAAILGAYLLAQGAAAPRIAEASTETALLAQIATKDSTGDGLPDWEKSLYGIPLTATSTDYFHLGMTDGEAVAKGLVVPMADTPASTPAPSTPAASAVVGGVAAPGANSLTDTFAQNFFALYISATQSSGGALTSDQINSIASQALQQLTASVQPAPDFKTAADIKISGNGPDALKAYAADAEAVFAAHSTNGPSNATDLSYLQDYLSSGNGADLNGLQNLAKAYQDTAAGLAQLTVPQEAQGVHLEIVNALARMAQIDNDFGRVDTDPLTAMFALEQYAQAMSMLTQSFGDLSRLFTGENVSLKPGTPGAAFVQILPQTNSTPTARP